MDCVQLAGPSASPGQGQREISSSIDSPWPTVAPTGCSMGLAPNGRIMKNISPGRSCKVSSSARWRGLVRRNDAHGDTCRKEIQRAAGASGLSFD